MGMLQPGHFVNNRIIASYQESNSQKIIIRKCNSDKQNFDRVRFLKRTGDLYRKRTIQMPRPIESISRFWYNPFRESSVVIKLFSMGVVMKKYVVCRVVEPAPPRPADRKRPSCSFGTQKMDAEPLPLLIALKSLIDRTYCAACQTPGWENGRLLNMAV